MRVEVMDWKALRLSAASQALIGSETRSPGDQNLLRGPNCNWNDHNGADRFAVGS